MGSTVSKLYKCIAYSIGYTISHGECRLRIDALPDTICSESSCTSNHRGLLTDETPTRCQIPKKQRPGLMLGTRHAEQTVGRVRREKLQATRHRGRLENGTQKLHQGGPGGL